VFSPNGGKGLLNSGEAASGPGNTGNGSFFIHSLLQIEKRSFRHILLFRISFAFTTKLRINYIISNKIADLGNEP
jgi:hypothetical protein